MREFNALLFAFVSNLAKVCARVKERWIGKSMHDTRPLLVFPSIGRIPYRQILDQRSRGGIRGIPGADRTFLYRVADMCSPRRRSPAPSYDAAKILPIRRDRRGKKKTPLKRQLTSKNRRWDCTWLKNRIFTRACPRRSSFKLRRDEFQRVSF